MRVAGGEQDADVAGQAGENQSLGAEMLQKDFQRRGEEAGLLWLQDEIIFFRGLEQFDDLTSASSILQTMRDEFPEVRSPLAKVVVDVNRRNAQGVGATFQLGNSLRGGQRVRLQFGAAFEFKIIDDVDQEQHRAGIVGRVAVQVGTLIRVSHGCSCLDGGLVRQFDPAGQVRRLNNPGGQ